MRLDPMRFRFDHKMSIKSCKVMVTKKLKVHFFRGDVVHRASFVRLLLCSFFLLLGGQSFAWLPLGALTQKKIDLVAGSVIPNKGSGAFDGPVKNARYNNPAGIAIDVNGNLYVADSLNNTIRKISPSGIVMTLAGQFGAVGLIDGQGPLALFNGPQGVAVDVSGNIYVADTYNNTIRKISSSGYVTTFAGLAGVSGSSDGFGSGASFNTPTGIAVDTNGYVYVADTGNSLIRKISPGGNVTTFVGGGTSSADGIGTAAGFNGPTGIAISSSGDLYVTDTGNYTLRKVSSSGVVTTVAGLAGVYGTTDGPSASARFYYLWGVFTDSNDNVYVCDAGNAIRKIASNGTVSTLAGLANLSGGAGYADGTGSTARFNGPYGITMDSSGFFYVTEAYNHTIRKIDSSGVVTTLSGSVTNGSADGLGDQARFNKPFGMAFDSSGNLYVADSANHTIRKIASSGLVTTIAGQAGYSGSTDGSGSLARFNNPTGLVVDTSGNLFVVDSGNSTIRKISTSGVVSTFAGAAGSLGTTNNSVGTSARFRYPQGIAIDSSNNLYIADTSNHQIRKITPAGSVTKFAGNSTMGSTDGTTLAKFKFPRGVTVDSAGYVYVADTGNQKIRKITPAGAVSSIAGSTTGNAGLIDAQGSSAEFSDPYGIVVTNSGFLYVTDFSNHVIRKIDSSGNVTTLVGGGNNTSLGYSGSADGVGRAATLSQPAGISVSSNGEIYFTDFDNSTVRKISTINTVSTVAGEGNYKSYGSNDGPGSQAYFNIDWSNIQSGITTDQLGQIYVSDSANHIIRKINKNGVVMTYAGLVGQPGITDGVSSTAQFLFPNGLAVDASNNLYVTDSGNNVIRKIAPDGQVSLFAGIPGSAGSTDGANLNDATFNWPVGIAINSTGALFVIDKGNNAVRKIENGYVTTLAGDPLNAGYVDGVGSAAQFSNPQGIAVDQNGFIYVADTGNNAIRKITSSGVVSTLAGGNGLGFLDGAGTQALFNYPIGIAVDTSGQVYVSDFNNQIIRKINSLGFVSKIIGNLRPGFSIGTLTNVIYNPRALAVKNGRLLFVSGNSIMTAPSN